MACSVYDRSTYGGATTLFIPDSVVPEPIVNIWSELTKVLLSIGSRWSH